MIVNSVVRIAHTYRIAVTLATYACIAAAAYLLAFLLRYEFAPPAEAMRLFLLTAGALVFIRAGFQFFFDVAQSRWRYAGTRDALRLCGANLGATAVFFILSWYTVVLPPVNRSIIVAEWFLTTFLISGLWVAYRTAFDWVRQVRSNGDHGVRRVLIAGAGEAGCSLAREMQRQPAGYLPVGFVDDDPIKRQVSVHGLKVLGGLDDLPALADSLNVEEIVIAVPSARPAELRRILAIGEQTRAKFKVLPGVEEVLLGRVRLNHLRDLRIEDLLGREPISLALPELLDDLRGQPVLITGAAGSIGSELARQVALHAPAALILCDRAETPLFFLERELRERFPDLSLVPVIGDIVDEYCMERLFRQYRPSRVYHAAAYKHVAMMQPVPREAVRNNVLGTWVLASAAARFGAEKFILVSTDKAVKPTSIMGASKRLAEVALLALQRRYPATAFAAVRFGNVLGSNGSVVPIFQQQIEERRPLTVTHPDATRYFMTIPEAVQLILKASLLHEVRGAIAMLDMGEPVRILDLARNMLRLAGIESNEDSIVFTGLQQGEKLHEELADPLESTRPTSVPKIRVVQPSNIAPAGILQSILEWDRRSGDHDERGLVAALCAVFPDLQCSVQSRSNEPVLTAEVSVRGMA